MIPKKFNAAYDFGKQVRAATDGRAGIGSGETVDPNKLAPRLQKMADSNSPTQPGRLQQFMGDEHANNLLSAVEQGRGAIQDFKPTTATGQRALQNLIRQNTGTGKLQTLKQALGFQPSTDWIGTFKDFNKLAPQEQAAQFGADAPKAQAFLKSQARWQLGKLLVKSGGALAATHITGIDRGVLHLILAE